MRRYMESSNCCAGRLPPVLCDYRPSMCAFPPPDLAALALPRQKGQRGRRAVCRGGGAFALAGTWLDVCFRTRQRFYSLSTRGEGRVTADLVLPWAAQDVGLAGRKFHKCTHRVCNPQSCWSAQVSDLLGNFQFVPAWRVDDVMVSYAPKGGSVGPHVDNYDVFLLQVRT